MLERDFARVRVAWSERLGRYPVERAVTEVCNAARSDLRRARLRGRRRRARFRRRRRAIPNVARGRLRGALGRDLERGRAQLKDTVVWNVEQGLKLTPADLERAARRKHALDARVAAFFSTHEFLVLPTVQVLPFPVEIEWVRAIEGLPMHTYIDWMATCYAISCYGLAGDQRAVRVLR